jgi:type III secretory pathway lipoprotein EscJ
VLLIGGCDVTIARGLQREDADRLALELNRRGVVASKLVDSTARDHYRLEVSANSVEAAFETLAARSFPEQPIPQDDAPLIPSKAEQQRRLAQSLSNELMRSIELLPGVQRARVHITLPVAPAMLFESSAISIKPNAAVLLLRSDRNAELVAQVRRLVSGAVPGLESEAITVVDTPRAKTAPACTELASIGPITVTKASARTLRAWLIAALSVHMLLAGALLFVLTRRRRMSSSRS